MGNNDSKKDVNKKTVVNRFQINFDPRTKIFIEDLAPLLEGVIGQGFLREMFERAIENAGKQNREDSQAWSNSPNYDRGGERGTFVGRLYKGVLAIQIYIWKNIESDKGEDVS